MTSSRRVDGDQPIMGGAFANFDAFYRHWQPIAVGMARKYGIKDAEAFSQDAMILFLERDYLDSWTPEGGRSPKQWVMNLLVLWAYNASKYQGYRAHLPLDEGFGWDRTEDRYDSEFVDLVRRVSDLLCEVDADSVDLWLEFVRAAFERDLKPAGRFWSARSWERLGISKREFYRRWETIRSVLRQNPDLAEGLIPVT